MQLTHAALPPMLAAGAGTVINVASVAGTAARPRVDVLGVQGVGDLVLRGPGQRARRHGRRRARAVPGFRPHRVPRARGHRHGGHAVVPLARRGRRRARLPGRRREGRGRHRPRAAVQGAHHRPGAWCREAWCGPRRKWWAAAGDGPECAHSSRRCWPLRRGHGVALVACSDDPSRARTPPRARRSANRWPCSAGTSRRPTCASTATTSSSTSTRRRRRPAVSTRRPTPCGSVSTVRWPTRSRATALGSCSDVTNLSLQPAVSPDPDKLSGTVCLGPLRDQTQVRGVYVYSPQDRIPGTIAAYPASFPVGLQPDQRHRHRPGAEVHQRRRVRRRRSATDADRARRADGVQRQRLHAARTRHQRAGVALPRRLDPTRRPADGAGDADAARQGAVVRVLGLRRVAAGAARLVAGRGVGAGVAVHAGRDQPGAAVCDGRRWSARTPRCGRPRD